ncbi:MAG: hypothetical protein WCJ56_00990 [bacterium]
MTEESLEIVSREIGLPAYRLEAWRNKEQEGIKETHKAYVVDPTDCKLAGTKQRGSGLTMDVKLYTSGAGGL